MNEGANAIVAKVIRALDAQGIGHMLVGSLSSNSYGIERSTKDADFIIELGDKSIAPVAEALEPEIVIDPQVSFESVTLVSRYEGKHVASGFKIEFFLLPNDAFQKERFQRRRKVPFGDIFAFLPSPEDVVLQKLRWYARAKRSKDLEDARDVINVQWRKLDLAYIDRWASEQGTAEQFQSLYDEAKAFE